MELDEKLALFVNWTGIFTFLLIIALHLISVLASSQSSSSSSSSSSSTGAAAAPGNPNSGGSSSSLSTGAIVGIVIGSVVGALLICLLCICFIFAARKRKDTTGTTDRQASHAHSELSEDTAEDNEGVEMQYA